MRKTTGGNIVGKGGGLSLPVGWNALVRMSMGLRIEIRVSENYSIVVRLSYELHETQPSATDKLYLGLQDPTRLF